MTFEDPEETRVPALEGDEEAAPRSIPAPAPAPMVIVQYRRNWWTSLLPPLLLLVLAVGIFKYRVENPDWGIWWSPRRASPAAPPRIAEAHPAPPTPLVEAGPLVARVEEVAPAVEIEVPPPPPAPADAEPRLKIPAEPIGFVAPNQRAEEAGEARVPFDMTGPADMAVTMVDRRVWPILPPPSREIAPPLEAEAPEVEAERIRKEREALNNLKDDLLEMDRRQAEDKRADEVRDAIRKNQESRADFLRELQGILDRQGSNGGPAIGALCNRYGRELPARSEQLARKMLSGTSGRRLDLKTKVNIFRGLSFPEAIILEEIAKQQIPNIGTRNGPKDRGEALVIAARQLVALPLGPSRAATAAVPASSIKGTSRRSSN